MPNWAKRPIGILPHFLIEIMPQLILFGFSGHHCSGGMMGLVLNCIVGEHDLYLLPVVVLLALLACSTTLAMITRARAAGQPRTRVIWVGAAGLVAGTGIWASHFVSMLAYNAPYPIAFDPGLTMLSIVVAMGLCTAGFAVMLRPGLGALGGVLTGLAVSGMHYTGMAALEIPAQPIWNMPLVAASVLIGASLAGLAGHFAQRATNGAYRVFATLCASLAILGMHFTAMAAVRFLPDAQAAPIVNMPPVALAAIVTAAAVFILTMAMVLALLDAYLAARNASEAARMRAYIIDLESTRADLSVALEAAEAAGRSKAAFLAAMSHELRTPLNAVIGFAEMIQGQACGAVDVRYRDYAGAIRTGGTRLLAVINDILDVSRFDAGKGELTEEIFDPGAKIAGVIRMMSGQAAQEQVELVSEVPPHLPRLNADRRLIRQILLNLLSNALKFTPAGGKVVVRAAYTPAGLELTVSDNGIGMAAGDINKALEPFGQVDSSLARKYEGTGLGLPLTRQMVQLHGGDLRLESTPGEGTSVTIILPGWRLAAQTLAA